MFETRERVRWADVDLVGIMRFSAVTRLIETAEQELMRDAGFPFATAFDAPEFLFPRRALKVDYFLPLRIDDALLLRCAITRIGGSSFTLKVDVVQERSGALATSAEMTMVCVDARSFGKEPLPPAFREALSRYSTSQRCP